MICDTHFNFQDTQQAASSCRLFIIGVTTLIEQTICTDQILSRLDEALAYNYKIMLDANIGKGAKNHLRSTQRAWLKERNQCTTRGCIEGLYRMRISAICDYPVLSGVHPICIDEADVY